mmetsp:Transcript_9124/g.21731  ORF Transcript_9124/g.21731 Transcript_9124/m.21731 type:complete len:132 (-) Transcript_9124:2555-2950(-)
MEDTKSGKRVIMGATMIITKPRRVPSGMTGGVHIFTAQVAGLIELYIAQEIATVAIAGKGNGATQTLAKGDIAKKDLTLAYLVQKNKESMMQHVVIIPVIPMRILTWIGKAIAIKAVVLVINTSWECVLGP